MQAAITHTEELIEKLQPVRRQLIGHPLYQRIRSVENLQIFTRHHVYAVWDFMSLLKALQIRLTAVTLPWKPVGDSETRYLINEIVTGEESDVDEQGRRASHFELYLRAMQQLGADTSGVKDFVANISIEDIAVQISNSHLPQSVRDFLQYTFDIALHAPTHVLAAVFTFGREDLIPDMFINIVRELAADHPERLSIFKYYLERHIEVDGDEHSILGKRMVEKLCGNDDTKWHEATAAAIHALEMRHNLWNGILDTVS